MFRETIRGRASALTSGGIHQRMELVSAYLMPYAGKNFTLTIVNGRGGFVMRFWVHFDLVNPLRGLCLTVCHKPGYWHRLQKREQSAASKFSVLNMQLYLSTTVGPSTTTQAEPPTRPSTAIATGTNPPPNPTPPSQNLAWIAGPVVGGVLGIAIAGGLIWWFGRRRNSTTVHQVSEGDNRPAPAVSELDSKPRKAIPELETKPSHAAGGQAGAHELPGEQSQRIPELDGGQRPVELPTDRIHRDEK
ncbi:unnamed protein product [Clonostachys solani]|uniref:Uncharacterized protein n=1 Tax=Clonostachys solani TaxID=160281 RepID=A0A9P0EPS7_9HYPO|nr:unnamed protein product [Clonostachys solani]